MEALCICAYEESIIEYIKYCSQDGGRESRMRIQQRE
jgi:hypothetical protein